MLSYSGSPAATTGLGLTGAGQIPAMAQPLHLLFRYRQSMSRDSEGRFTAMLQSRSVQDYIRASEDRALMLFSAWLLACALLLEEHYQQLD